MVSSLNENRDFKRAYYKGKSLAHPLLVTYALKNRRGEPRMGVTVSKKVGNAVKRNRAKRVISAAFRELAPSISGAYDIVLVARSKTGLSKSPEVLLVMERQFRQLGLVP